MRSLYLILILFFLSLNLRPSITSVGPLLDIIRADLGMSGVVASLITTLPVLCMGIFSLLSIKFSQRLSIEASLLIASALIFASTLVRAFTHSSSLFILTSLGSGIGIGIIGPLISGFIKKYFPDQLGVTSSIYAVSMVIGAAVATTFSIPLFNLWNQSWQLSLSSWSILALIAALLLLPLILSNRTANAPSAIPSLRVTNKRVYLYMLLLGFVAAVFYSVTAWLAPYAQSIGMNSKEGGYLLTVFTLVQIPVSLVLPIIAARSGSQIKWLMACCLSEVAGIVLLLLSFSPWAAILLLGIGAGGLFPLALLLPMHEASTSNEATSWSAQTQFGGFIIGASGPLVVGFTIDIFHSFTPALIVLLLTMLVMLLTIIRLGRRKQEPSSSILQEPITAIHRE
ncbi:CynX/NimT family MFS transporter [Paenibacillus sp. 1001270B_150601_E10]|uniref:MFS transporter n=1 Tax=Paenibacillus sp. 1001270B_150601_E10 TaxID=2787079 RepID=UPI0018A0C08F|nr:MFS transporter [Paenibacillus sp. 1001270B_150601_E10]